MPSTPFNCVATRLIRIARWRSIGTFCHVHVLFYWKTPQPRLRCSKRGTKRSACVAAGAGPSAAVAVQVQLDAATAARLRLSTQPFLEKQLERIGDGIESLHVEVQDMSTYERLRARQEQQKALWLQRRQEVRRRECTVLLCGAVAEITVCESDRSSNLVIVGWLPAGYAASARMLPRCETATRTCNRGNPARALVLRHHAELCPLRTANRIERRYCSSTACTM